MAVKCAIEINFLLEYRHVNGSDQGGLWKVNENIFENFSIVKAYFISSTKIFSHKVMLITGIMQNCTVLEGFDK